MDVSMDVRMDGVLGRRTQTGRRSTGEEDTNRKEEYWGGHKQEGGVLGRTQAGRRSTGENTNIHAQIN